MKIVAWSEKLIPWKNHFFNLLDKDQQIIVSKYPIFFNIVDLGAVAGRHKAVAYLNYIEVSPFLTEAEAKETSGHEYAHLCDWFLNKNHDHGPSWKKLMCQIGLAPHETHEIPIKERKILGDVMSKIDKHNKKK